jgi:hypothetical protein
MHGVADTERLKLSAEPDGFGFFYGWAERNGERVRVDVLPPEHLWRGDIKLEGQNPTLGLEGSASDRCRSLRACRHVHLLVV